jgi:hypothetical protein
MIDKLARNNIIKHAAGANVDDPGTGIGTMKIVSPKLTEIEAWSNNKKVRDRMSDMYRILTEEGSKYRKLAWYGGGEEPTAMVGWLKKDESESTKLKNIIDSKRIKDTSIEAERQLFEGGARQVQLQKILKLYKRADSESLNTATIPSPEVEFKAPAIRDNAKKILDKIYEEKRLNFEEGTDKVKKIKANKDGRFGTGIRSDMNRMDNLVDELAR